MGDPMMMTAAHLTNRAENPVTPQAGLTFLAKDDRLRTSILKWAQEIRAWNIPWHTGIYPREMAAFLGLCDFCGIRSIVESGRGAHAYSTQILGEYDERTGATVVSIDRGIQSKGYEERLRLY